MRTKYSQKFTLTKKRFKLALAVLGLLAAWMIALSGLVLTSSLASAERNFDGRSGHASTAAHSGTGSFVAATSGEVVADNGGARFTQNGPAVCDDRLGQDGSLPNCDLVPSIDPDSNMHGRTTLSTFSGSIQPNSDGKAGQQRDAAIFSSQDGAFGGVSLLGHSSQFTPFSGAISELGPAVSAQSSRDALSGRDDGSATRDGSAQDLSEGLAEDAKRLANKMSLATPDSVDLPIMAPVNEDLLLSGSALPGNSQSTTQSIPEPFTLSLFAAGLIGIKRRRSRKLYNELRAISKVRGGSDNLQS